MWQSISVASLLVSTALGAPPAQDSVTTVLGPKAYRDGDVIEITDVTSTSPRLEQGDSVTIRGRFRLESQAKANLDLYVTQTEGDGQEETDATQRARISNGTGEFELKCTIKHRGVLHVTFYDPDTGRSFGGTYFGTAQQMKRIANMDVSYYLSEAAPAAAASQRDKEALRMLRRLRQQLQRQK